MHLISLTFRHLRNMEALDWRPAPGLNLIWGDNGQGKTNLLEGIHLALTGRSFRTHRDEELLNWQWSGDEADPPLAQAVVERKGVQRRLRLLLGRGWKRSFADDCWLARLADLWREASVVTFAPEEAGLLKGPPSGRRRFLDIVLSQISRVYLDHLQRYHQALRQINAVYKTQPAHRDVRDAASAYYPLLAQAGAALNIMRARRLREAAASLNARFGALGGVGRLELSYDPDLKFKEIDPADPALAESALAQACLQRLEESFEDGRRLGQCALGVHRDDFTVRLDEADLRRYGSQGQQRLVALTLKLESARWIEESIGEPPILLLDDFGSELDPVRREAVLNGLQGTMQVFITATHPADLGPLSLFGQARRMVAGTMSNAQ